jgi:two-component system, chemotaxis family, sensor histidine kinase and response regulator PixL
MKIDKDREVKLHFIEEASNHLNTIEIVLLEPQVNIHNINNAMRAAHSIKGGAAMVGYDALSQYAHQLEDAFKVLKTNKQNINLDEIQPFLLASVDDLRRILSYYSNDFNGNGHLSQNESIENIVKNINNRLNQLHEILGDANPEDAATILATEEQSQELIPLIFQTQVEEYLQQLELLIQRKSDALREELVTMAGELGGLGYMLQLESFTQLCESVITAISSAQTDREVLEISNSALQAWRQSQISILEPPPVNSQIVPTSPVPPTCVIPSTSSGSLIRVGTQQLEFSNDLSNELNILCQSLKFKLESLNQLFDNLKLQGNNIDLGYRNIYLNATNKIHLKPLQKNITQLQHIIATVNFKLADLDKTSSTLNRTAQNLQHSLTQILMRPLTDILERFPRALHDLSLEYNKPVQLKITGGETLVERNILDTLQEPLLHILRNAFDHGIEDRKTRINLGKPEQGLIDINITTTQNHIVIVVSDDGYGISVDKVRKHAEALGFDRTLLAQANDDELLSLIFESGFSTSNEVTTLSGRGVGMDVVRSNLHHIGADVKVSTQVGKGTQFTLTIPFNVLISQVLFIESCSMLLACPASSTREVLFLTQENILLEAGQQYFRYQNINIPLVDLAKYMHFNHKPSFQHHQNILTKTNTKTPSALILDCKDQTVAIKLDHCYGEQETVIRQVEGNIPLPTGFSNCTITSNGQIVPIINWDNLLSTFSIPVPKHTTKNGAFKQLLNQNESRTILVVDDSTNIRNLLSLTLEKAGYQVEEASDGLQGLEKLKTGLLFKAVICDIDMPNLDGLGFLARVKAQPQFKNIPIILLTSHTANKYRQLAFQLGAKAYLCKPYNEYELLEVLNE